MILMYRYCFWCSVRLGAIIVASTCMVQCVVGIIACGFGLGDLEGTSSTVDHWLQTNNLMLAKNFFKAVRDDTKTSLLAFIVILLTYFCSCVLLIYAAFQCNTLLILPFISLDFVRLTVFSFALVVILMIIKENTLNLGVIIGCSISGGFTLLYLWYQWFCVISLWQTIREVRRVDRQLVIRRENAIKNLEGTTLRNNVYNSTYYMPNIDF